MAPDEQIVANGDVLFEAFVEQVKQVLEHLYDFAYLQQHPLARFYDSGSDASARAAGRQLRYELIKGIESLKPATDAHFRAPDARLYEVLHLCYVENLTVQEVATELGLSDRQAYRDLKRGQQTVAAMLWDNRLPPPPAASDTNGAQTYSLESEIARLRLNISPVDIGALFEQSRRAVQRLADQQAVDFAVALPAEPMILSTDPALAHQILVSTLSYMVQQARPGTLTASFALKPGAITLALHYPARVDSQPVAGSAVATLAQRLHWAIADDGLPGGECELVLRMVSGSTTILVIDDNEGWIELLNRFFEGSSFLVVATRDGQDGLLKAQELNPSAIILDVMMPDKDGWELLQRLRALPTTANVPILVCTGFNDPQLAWSLGASAFVAKPATRETIMDALHDVGIL